tara:strand:+ start:166 stop:342 length:177 start_codon:yes stop_codon:yes gene_type:complete
MIEKAKEMRMEKLEKIRLMVIEFDNIMDNCTEAEGVPLAVYKTWKKLMWEYYPQETGW